MKGRVFMSKARELVSLMTLEEKASLCSGKDFWNLKGVERLGLKSIMVTDGPHGLRKQDGAGDHLGINKSVESTCFPTACATACSFDRSLMREIGNAIGEECLKENVSVILGPGANIKRSPLCGRNFEYFSEDPYITGEMAGAIIEGIQGKGIGVSLKHFAANNQEQYRMTSNSVIDERALREIYLSGFEAAIKNGKPWTVMCSYNLLNGTYASENKKLLTDILRTEWGFDGLVMTDWGATNDRVAGLASGLDLEMPSSNGVNDDLIVQAVKAGKLSENLLDIAATRIVDLILKAQHEQKEYDYDKDAHHALAKKAATESAVLLKNDSSVLPASRSMNVAVIGAFAKSPRYQGSGSSKINPYKIDSAFDAMISLGINAEYAEGYNLSGNENEDEKVDEACKIAWGKDRVFVFAGLPEEYESEGFDRTSLDLPHSHNKLINELAKVNENVVVILYCGSPVLMPWADKVKGILLAYLGGQAVGSACADLLFGLANPCGKLAETYPCKLEDTPCFNYFPGTPRRVEYRESIFVGYRYYDAAKKDVAFPFGYGLSYTSFAYSDLSMNGDDFKSGDQIKVKLKVRNTGSIAGAEIVQIYVSMPESVVFSAPKELKGFCKVFLNPGEIKEVEFALNNRSFSFYNPSSGWTIEGGIYEIQAASSSRHMHLSCKVRISGEGQKAYSDNLKNSAPTYYSFPSKTFLVSDTEYAALYGKPLPSETKPGAPYTINSTLFDIKDTFIGRQMLKSITKQMDAMFGSSKDMKRMMDAMIMEMPLRGFAMMSQGQLSSKRISGIVDILNKKMLRGILRILL